MGVLDRFEKGIERAVNGVFARAFRSEVQPVELASALKREADDHASIVGRTAPSPPNSYVVELGPADHRRLAQWEDALGDELATVLSDHALQQRYAFVGPVSVRFERSEELDTGVFRVRSRTPGGRATTPRPRTGRGNAAAAPPDADGWYQQPGRRHRPSRSRRPPATCTPPRPTPRRRTRRRPRRPAASPRRRPHRAAGARARRPRVPADPCCDRAGPLRRRRHPARRRRRLPPARGGPRERWPRPGGRPRLDQRHLRRRRARLHRRPGDGNTIRRAARWSSARPARWPPRRRVLVTAGR